MTTLKGLNSKDDMSPKLQTSDSGMDEMRCMFPDTDTTRLREVMEAFNRHKDAFEINTPLRIAHFLGQIAVESSFPPAGLAPFEALQESCNYSNVRNTDWGTRYCHFYVGFEDTTLNDCTHSCVTGTLSLMEDGCPEPIKTDLPECTPIEAICDDGVDNDGDGLVDCDDEECMDSTICDPEIYCEILSLITITQRDFNQLHYSFERDGSLDHTLSRLGELGLSTALTQQLINNLQTVRYDIEDSFLSGTYSYKDSVYLRLATMRQNFLSWKMNAFTKYPVLESTSFARKFILKSSGGEEQPSEEACEEIIKILIDGACENQESALSCHGIANVAGSGQTFLYFEPNISPHLLNKSRIYDLANGIEFVTSFKPSSTYERVSGQGPFLVITQDVFGCITSCIIEPEACSVDEDGQHIDFDTINVTHGACIRSDILIQGALSCGTLVEVLFNLDILKAECISYQSDEYGPIESDFEKICPNEDGQITITITDGFNIIVVDSIYINSHPPYNIDGCDSEDDQNCDDTENEKDNDTDGDGTDNEFDNDDDGDGIPDLIDTTPQGLDSDIDDDEVKNEEDCDLDGDNSPNQLDNDTDGDLIYNELDPDDDNDGILDIDDESPQGLETECIEDCMTTDDEDSDGLAGCEDPDCMPQLVVQKIEVGESECGENNGTISVQLAGNQSFENFRICVGDSCSKYGVSTLEGIALGEYTLTIEKQGGCAIQYTPAISLDSDSDGILNGTDKDINNDSIPNIEQTGDNDDPDGDGIINLHDYDDDNDGILDEADTTPYGPSEEVCNNDIDDDGNGLIDCDELDCLIESTTNAKGNQIVLKSLDDCIPGDDFEACLVIYGDAISQLTNSAEEGRIICEKISFILDTIKTDPFVFFRNCFDPDDPNSIWIDLAAFTVPEVIRAEVENRNDFGSDAWFVQDIQDAEGTVVNADFYSVNLGSDLMINGQPVTPQEIFEYIRLNFTDFDDGCNSTFVLNTGASNEQDEERWLSDDPVGAVVDIDIEPATDPLLQLFPDDDATVVTSHYANDPNTNEFSWTFSTISTPFGINGDHPVSGHRQFGITIDPNTNEWTFYVRGLDRVTDNWVPFIDNNNLVLGGGHDLWTCVMDNVAQLFNGEVNEPVIHRPDWEEVKNKILEFEISDIIDCISFMKP